MATTFYDALNAANLNALRMLDTQLKAQDDRNPVPSFLNTINERIRMQQALNAGKERQDYYNELRSKINTGGNGGNKPTLAGIGADASGVYGVGNSNPTQSVQPSASISVGSYAGDVAPQSNKFTFNESDYVPSAQNGYHLGDYPQTEMYGDPTDYQRQMAANAIGYNLGSLEPRQQTWFSKTQQNTPQDSFGKAFQAAENPTTTQSSNFISGNQAKQFGSLMQTARNNGGQFNQQDWNTLKSFQNPVSDVAPTVGGINTGATGNQAFDEKMNLRRWLEWDAQQNGVTNPLVSLDRYNLFMQPIRQQAELDELRNAYYIMNSDPNDKRFTPEQRMNARTLVEFDKKNPYYVDDHDMNVERFNWAKQNFNNQQALFPYQLERAQLGTQLQRQQLDANELANTGEYAGVNLEGDSWYRKNDGVDLSNLQGRALAGLNHASVIFKSMFGEPLMVTSGRDSDAHMGGQYSHYTGWKVDVSSGMDSKRLEDPQERAKFIQALGSVGIIVNDEWAKDKHLDLNFQNYHGNYTKNRNRNQNKNGQSNRSSSNSKNKNSSSSLHSALENLADVSNEFNPEMDMNSKDGQNYKKKYDGAFQDVKNQLNETYPGLGEWIKKQVQQGKSSEDICMEISGAIKQDINTNLPNSKIADVVEELMLDYDNRVKRKQVAPNVAKRMNIKSHTSFTDKQGRGGSVYLGEPEFNRYAGMTDEDIRTQNADRTYDGYARSISSQARLLGNKEFEEGKTKPLRQKHDARVDRDKKRRE